MAATCFVEFLNFMDRISTTKSGNTVTISIVPQKNSGVVIFLMFWLTFWVIGGAFAFWQFINPDSELFLRLFIGVWLFLWYKGLITSSKLLLWKKFGLEKIILEPNKLVHKIIVMNKEKTEAIESSLIDSVKASGSFDDDKNQLNFFDEQSQGTIAIDYDNKRLKVGSKLKETEADKVAQLINGYLQDQLKIN